MKTTILRKKNTTLGWLNYLLSGNLLNQILYLKVLGQKDLVASYRFKSVSILFLSSDGDVHRPGNEGCAKAASPFLTPCGQAGDTSRR